MKRIVIIFSVMMFVIANVGLSQDIVNETGTDGKFIVRDAEQQEAMVIEDGNVGITGELSVEQMPEGSVGNPYVVWDPSDKKFKTVARIFSKLSPLSEPLETKSWHSFSSDEVDEDGNLISASVQGVEAINWNRFDTDHGYIQLGPANTTFAHIYTDRTRFMFNKGVTFYTGEFGTAVGNDLKLQAGGVTRLLFKASNGFVGIGTTNPTNKLHLYDAGNYGDLVIEDQVPFVWFDAFVDGNSGLTFREGGSSKGWLYHNANSDGILITGGDGGWDPDIFAANNGNVGIGTDAPAAKLDVEGDVILGASGSRFLEIREITGVTGTSYFTSYSDKLPVGWTGAKTRVLSVEIQGGGATANWGFGHTDGTTSMGGYLENNGRTFYLWYPNSSTWHGRAWRAIIMRMP